LETFTEPKELEENPHYQEQRQQSLSKLSDDMIDAPIVEIVNAFNSLPYCFTIQCCYGHFIYDGQMDSFNCKALPVAGTINNVEYRIAYITFCIDNNNSGRGLLIELKKITSIDPENIQFGCAEWFWKRQVNSYALQVEPDRFKHQDKAILNYGEALRVENVRNTFFVALEELGKNHQNRGGHG
jgi:hypothetical protein